MAKPSSSRSSRKPAETARGKSAAGLATIRPVVTAPVSWRWLDHLSLAILAAVVIARMMMLEAIRSSLPASPGAPPIPAGPGPTTGLLLDLLACVPALLQCLRRWLDPRDGFRAAWSVLPLALVGIWAVCSTLWAGDKFAALVSSLHLVAAVAALWAATQAVRSWLHLRLIAGLCFGLLGILVLQSVGFLMFERPALEQEWAANGQKILEQRGITPGSFEALQFSNKVLHGELMGFNASPNTYAALLVVTMIVCVGIVLDRIVKARRVEADSPALPWLIGLAITAIVIVLPAIYMIRMAQSRTAYATTAMGIIAIAIVARFLPHFTPRARSLYFAAVIAAVVGTAATIGHGLYHGTLFHDSLNFRWRYWVGAARLVKLHPLTGVGWENFSQPYLGVRLPTATEEIKDPHNFLVRFFAELGIVGGILLIAWLLRFAWEVTRPRIALSAPTDPIEEHETEPRSVGPLLAVVGTLVFGLLLNLGASVDFNQESSYIQLELVRRIVFMLPLLAALLTALRFKPTVRLDDRPAPWVLHCLVIALGLFAVHNLIDFAGFELGPMFLFALLTGVTLGARLQPGAPSQAGRKLAMASLGVGGLLWLVTIGVIVIPIGAAETLGQEGDELIRREKLTDGARTLAAAYEKRPANADYAYRAAQAWRLVARVERQQAAIDRQANRTGGAERHDQAADEASRQAIRLFGSAIVADPTLVRPHIARADTELERPQPDLAAVVEDLQQAVAGDPNNLQNRIQLGRLLERAGRPVQAAEAYATTLSYNDQLTREERKRLTAAEVQDLTDRIAKLRSPKGQ